MPHFFAKNLNSQGIANRSGKHFNFVLEAVNMRDKSTLILAQSKSNSHQKIMLLKQEKGDKFLVKFNKHFRVQSREAIKNALKDYANITNAEIISHNLNANKVEVKSQYLLDSHEILGLLDKLYESNYNKSCFKNIPKMLEIGFGSGRHILNLAKNNPNAFIIGLEIYRPAILQVLRQIELLGLTNLYLASIDARVFFEILPHESLNVIFLHFPVPWEKNPQRRVFSKVFLTNAIRTLNLQNGRFELITDSKEYFDFAKKLSRIYNTKTDINPQNTVVSKYEARWRRLQKNIYKLEIFPRMHLFSALVYNIKNALVKTPKIHKKMLEFKVKNINIQAIHTYPKICKKEYFLQIKDKYKFSEGFIIYVVFGAYYAPNSIYIVIRKNTQNSENTYEILGNIIPTKANLAALDELQFLESYA